ncbi:MAG: DUF1064 domain-containing protein [Candidatus Krumholzibacteriia bacterium]
MPKKRHKYGVGPKARRTRGEITFDSIKEAQRYDSLLLAQQQGAVRLFLRQVPFHLPGRVQYRLDFLVFWADETVTFEDVKGHRTQTYTLKKKQVESIYGIEITEI